MIGTEMMLKTINRLTEETKKKSDEIKSLKETLEDKEIEIKFMRDKCETLQATIREISTGHKSRCL